MQTLCIEEPVHKEGKEIDKKSFFVQPFLIGVPRHGPLRYSQHGFLTWVPQASTVLSPEQRIMQRTVSAILKHNQNLVPCYLNKSSASRLHPCLQEPSTLEKETSAHAPGLPLSPSQGRETEARVSKNM